MSRGLDIYNITHVINYNLPDDIENYTHRSGRTARAGRKGESLVLINTREAGKIRAIERQMRTTFTLGTIPNAGEICEIQLMKLIEKVIATEVKEADIEPFMPKVREAFEGLSKEEVIKQFVSAEFNRFIDYYEKAGDLNAQAGKGEREERSPRRERRNDGQELGKTRFFVNLGKRDGLNPGGLLRLVCDATGLTSSHIGRIDLMPSFSFFEADDEHAEKILRKVNGANYEGNTVSVEITKKKSSSNRGGGGGGGRRDGGSFGGKFKGDRNRKEGGFGDRPRKEHRKGQGQGQGQGSKPRSFGKSFGK